MNPANFRAHHLGLAPNCGPLALAFALHVAGHPEFREWPAQNGFQALIALVRGAVAARLVNVVHAQGAVDDRFWVAAASRYNCTLFLVSPANPDHPEIQCGRMVPDRMIWIYHAVEPYATYYAIVPQRQREPEPEA